MLRAMGACASSPQETPKVCLEERMAEDEVVYALVSSKGDRHYEDCAKVNSGPESALNGTRLRLQHDQHNITTPARLSDSWCIGGILRACE